MKEFYFCLMSYELFNGLFNVKILYIFNISSYYFNGHVWFSLIVQLLMGYLMPKFDSFVTISW